MTDLLYRECRPTDILQPFVACYWWLDNPNAGKIRNTFQILPDGCVYIVSSKSHHIQNVIVGALTRSISVPFNRGSSFFGVRFQPGAAHSLFGLNARDSANTILTLSEVWLESNKLCLEVRNSNADTQVEVIEQALYKQLSMAKQPEPKVQAAVNVLTQTSGNLSVKSLSDELNVSRQHLTRMFKDHIGFNPKTFARIVRMRDLFACASKSGLPNWASLAAEFGYYDQAHMICDFKDLTGLTPKELHLQNKNQSSAERGE